MLEVFASVKTSEMWHHVVTLMVINISDRPTYPWR
jgi:hypothetical protein